MSTFPVGVTTTAVQAGPAFSIFGDETELTVTVRPYFGDVNQIVWSATGDTFNRVAQTKAATGAALEFVVPVVDQAGWVDGAGDDFTMWGYEAKIVASDPADDRNHHVWRKMFQPVAADGATFDLDQVPDSTDGSPDLAPTVRIPTPGPSGGPIPVGGAPGEYPSPAVGGGYQWVDPDALYVGRAELADLADPTDVAGYVTTAAATTAVASELTNAGVMYAAKAPALATTRWVDPQGKDSTSVANPNSALFSLAQITTGLPTGISYGWQVTRIGAASAFIGQVRFGGSGAAGQTYQTVVTPGEVVSVSAYLRTDQTGGKARIDLQWWDSAGTLLSTTTGTYSNFTAANTWEQRAASATVPTSAHHVTVQGTAAMVTGNATTGAKMSMTGVMLVSGTVTVPTYLDGESVGYAWSGTRFLSTAKKVYLFPGDFETPTGAQTKADTAAGTLKAGLYADVVSKNLYNPNDSDVLTDKVPNTTTGQQGTYVTLANYRTSGFIAVTPGATYPAQNLRYYEWYDASKVSKGLATNTGSNSAVVTLTAPAGAAYLRVTHNYATNPQLQVEAGSSATSYEAYFAPKYSLTAKLTTAVQLAAAAVRPKTLTLVKSGHNLTLSRVFDSTKTLTETMDLTGSSSGGFSWVGTSLDTIGTFHDTYDDITPIRTSAGTIGAGHGSVTGYVATLWADGERVTADGTYSANRVILRESYLANTGVRVTNVIPWTLGACRVSLDLLELTPTTLAACGAVQSVIMAATGYTVKRWLFGVTSAHLADGTTPAATNWSAGVDMTSYSTDQVITTADLAVSTIPPVFHLDVLYDSSANPVIGFAMGYLPFGVRSDDASTNSTRLTHASGKLWDLRGTKKSYPNFTTGESSGWGHLRAEAFRVYLDPTQIAAILAAGGGALGAWEVLSTVANVTP